MDSKVSYESAGTKITSRFASESRDMPKQNRFVNHHRNKTD